MRRIALVIVALAALAGCGGGAESQPEEKAFASADVIEHFRRQPGAPVLERAAHPDAVWDQLGLGLDASQAQLRRYGTFSIYVVNPSNTEAVGSLLRNKETKKALTPSPRGIYWEYDTLAHSYVAHTRYGANVVLAWWNEREDPSTDARWERLNEMMSALVRG